MPVKRLSSTGEVIEVALEDGRLAYLQDSGLVLQRRVVRFLKGLYLKPLRGEELRTVVSADSVYRACCDTQALLSESYAQIIGHEAIPEREMGAPDLIVQAIGDDWTRWWIRVATGEEVTASQYLEINPERSVSRLARLTDMPGPAFLRARLAEEWRPGEIPPEGEAKQVRVPLSERLRPILEPHTRYISFFPSEALGASYIEAMRKTGVSFEVSHEEASEGCWEIALDTDDEFAEPFARLVSRVTETCGGTYDGDIDMSQ